MTEPTRVGRRAAALAATVAVLGVALSVPAAWGLRAAERRSVDRATERRTDQVRTAVTAGLGRYTDTARQVAASLRTASATAFTDVTAAIDLPGATGVSVVVPATAGQLPALRTTWRSVTFTPAAGAAEHWFVVLDHPLDGTLPRPGRDLTTSPERPVTTAAQVTVSAPIPGSRSWVVVGFRPQAFLTAVLRDASVGPAVGVTLAASGAVLGRAGTLDERAYGERFTADGRTWDLRVSEAAVKTRLDAIALAAGAALSVVVGLLAYVLANARARAEARVAAATGELRRTEQSARQQAALLQAVLTGIDEGVAVADEDGTLALLNPSAQATLAVPGPAAPDDRQRYGVYRVDGVTPYPGEDLPLRRALTGAACTDEFVIRTAARPDGVRVRVSAQPLDLGADRRGALAVARDVTALRAHEADLSAFAGFAARDLQGPLANVLGYLARAEDELTEARMLGRQPRGVTAALTHLARVRTGTERMRRLVDDLLAYASARDADLRASDVDLNALVADVLAVVLRPDRPPHMVIRRLPPVRGDGLLLRRLFTTVLGNALKYTPLDETPRIAVRARPVPGNDDWVRVEIADHGIGLPPGQHERIFNRFHADRADAGGLHPETGLGLAICRRIVERHGGTIGAAANPGGGTVVWFTLPTAVADVPDRDLVGAVDAG